MAQLQIILEKTIMSDNFSILLVLKGRPAYTIRFLVWLNKIKFPYKIIIADGGSDEYIHEILGTSPVPRGLNNLNFEYVQYPYDKTLDNFHEKMADAVQKIDSATVSIMDNDDFLLLEGIPHCLKELKENPQYSSARGAIYSIHISHNIVGRLSMGPSMYTKYPDSIIAKTAADRMIEQTKRFHGNWHNITRSNHIKASWRMINVVKPQNMRFTEQMTGYLNTLWGDGYRSSEFPWLLHHQGTRVEVEGGGTLESHYPDQETWINSDYWLEEFNKMTEVIGVAISEYDKIPIAEALSIFRKTYPLKLPDLKDLLEKRIDEAVKLGYNSDRIDKLFQVIGEHELTKVDPIEDIQAPSYDCETECTILSDFLTNPEGPMRDFIYAYQGNIEEITAAPPGASSYHEKT